MADYPSAVFVGPAPLEVAATVNQLTPGPAPLEVWEEVLLMVEVVIYMCVGVCD